MRALGSISSYLCHTCHRLFTAMTSSISFYMITRSYHTNKKEAGAMERSKKAIHDDSSFKFEVALVLNNKEYAQNDAILCLLNELRSKGMMVEVVHGRSDNIFIKVGASLDIIGRAAERLHIRKPTILGIDLKFDWEHRAAFEREPDNSLFSWSERYICLHNLIFGIVNQTGSQIKLSDTTKQCEFVWEVDESLYERLHHEGIIKEIFPLHDERQVEKLLHSWAFNWFGFTSQPLDTIYSYFGAKIATYFAFLGMYTSWLLFPAALAIAFHLFNLRSWRSPVLPLFSLVSISWAGLFLQFWKRKIAALSVRWRTSHIILEQMAHRKKESKNRSQSEMCVTFSLFRRYRKVTTDQKQEIQQDEWCQHLKSLRNSAIIIFGILCFQLPFELAYAHVNNIFSTYLFRYLLTAVYLLAIQYYTKLGGKMSLKLAETQHHDSKEAEVESLVYKVFGLYFVQSYMGLFYHAFILRDLATLQDLLMQRLIVSQLLTNILDNLVPYGKHCFTKYKALKGKKYFEGILYGKKLKEHTSTVENEYMKPAYIASVGKEYGGGLFDDFLELTLQFGMVTMFSCALPLVFIFAAVSNLTKIRADSFKLLCMLRRPAPSSALAIGAWFNIFQFLGVMAICTNCALLANNYDQEGRWKIEPDLAAVIIFEHALLLIKFCITCFVPEEPKWVKENQLRCLRVQDVCSHRILKSICNIERKQD